MIYQLKITLDNSEPPIWRRIEVSPETKLDELHKIVQTTMGWKNGHLHHFMIGNAYYTPPSKWDDFGNDYTGMKIRDFLRIEGAKMKYEYDFGDSWIHTIRLEKIKEKERGVRYPRCIKGKRACPPEDCGGVWGYMELESIMKDKKHEQYEEMVEWLGRKWDPEKFEVERIDKKLREKNFGVLSFGF